MDDIDSGATLIPASALDVCFGSPDELAFKRWREIEERFRVGAATWFETRSTEDDAF